MSDTSKLAAPELDANAIEQARALIGMPIRVEQWNHEASRDVICHYAWGIGDDNPLFCDPAYAARTPWGGMIAHPTFLYSVFDAVVAPGLPDIQWVYSGTDWSFHEPVRRNDEITAEAEYVDAVPLQGKRVSNMLVQTGRVTYRNQHGRVVAVALSHCFRLSRRKAAGGLKLAPREEHRYSAQELQAIQEAAVNEYRRGAETRWFEDVQSGEAMPGTVRGPINRLDMTCYYAGSPGTSGYKSTKLKWLYAHWARNAPEKLPNNYDKSYYGAAISPSIGHQDEGVATSEIGMPGPYDNGPQRIGMIASCATNWMGDDGILRSYSMRVKQPVIFGDTTYTKGRVVGTRVVDGKGLVDAELWAENQFGQVTATGHCTIELPRRNP